MGPPIWPDEQGRPREQRPCPRCGRAIPVLSIPTEHLTWWGWEPWQLWSGVEWCGHQIEGIPVPVANGRWRLIVVAGGGSVTRHGRQVEDDVLRLPTFPAFLDAV